MKNPPIYLASPYSHKLALVKELRYRAAQENVVRLLMTGIESCVYSPIVHCHWMSEVHDMPSDFAFWEIYDKQIIRAMPRFGILLLPNWAASVGVAGEREYAESLGRTVEMFPAQGDFFDALTKLS